jgi:hypothetical protein
MKFFLDYPVWDTEPVDYQQSFPNLEISKLISVTSPNGEVNKPNERTSFKDVAPVCARQRGAGAPE